MEGLLSDEEGLIDGEVMEVLIQANKLSFTLILCRQWQIETALVLVFSSHDEELPFCEVPFQ